jgi:hypothetical protein
MHGSKIFLLSVPFHYKLRQLASLSLGLFMLSGIGFARATSNSGISNRRDKSAHYDTTSMAIPKRIPAIKLKQGSIELDGRLSEDIWDHVPYATNFTQLNPDEGEPARQKTKVAFVYGEDALYVGARMYSEDPEHIQSIVRRRDDVGKSERIIITLDTYLDRRTAYSFALTASGTRADYYHYEDNPYRRDYSWDPVWSGEVTQDSLGWVAEFRIPFSQLRFNEAQVQHWGLNINRYIPNTNEDTFWIYIPKDKTGWASRFGLLTNIRGIEPPKRFELLPYTAGEAFRTGELNQQNPFTDRWDLNGRIGGDIKVGIGANLTVDATINPDFGQVEADPAQVNLSAFETRFSERRPFFTEGRQLLDGGGANYFYSRRIGSAPSYYPDADYVDIENNTPILGAAKITGRLPSGLSIGALSALTAKGHATYYNTDTDRYQDVLAEPLTSYNVVRVQQEFGKYASTAGIILTGLSRNMEGKEHLTSFLHDDAITGGLDWKLRFLEGEYQLEGDAGFSYVHGSPEAIANTQQSSAHYYQRPDADYITLDTTRTSLSGFRGRVEFNREGGEHWLWGVEAATESPGFELNDMGILNTADDINTRASVRWRENEPSSWYHSYDFSLRYYRNWNYGGIHTGSGIRFATGWQWPSFWNAGFDINYNPRSFSDNATRGGPLMGNPRSWSMGLSVNTNRGETPYSSAYFGYYADEWDGWSFNTNFFYEFQMGNQWEVSIRPSYNQQESARQYLTTLDNGDPATFGKRYVFSRIKRNRLSIRLRINYSITPDLSIEGYAEPFAARGDYFSPGELPKPRAYELRTYGTDGTTLDRVDENTLRVTDGQQQFEIDDPDFLVRSFRSNLVLRYQWRPGSTLFLVWQQNRFNSYDQAPAVDPSDLTQSLLQTGDNVFAVKLSYWFPVN